MIVPQTNKLNTIKNHVFLCKADQRNKKESINILTSSMITPFVSICSNNASFLADHPEKMPAFDVNSEKFS